MKRLTILGAILLLGGGLQAASYYTCPDVPTDLAASTHTPWQIIRSDAAIYTLAQPLPPNTPLDAMHHMCNGEWLVSVDVPTDLGGTTYQPDDVVRFDGGVVYTPFFCGGLVGVPPGSVLDAFFLDGGDGADLIVSFDVPTDLTGIGGTRLDPADLVRFVRTGASCGNWVVGPLYFDASAASPPVPLEVDVIGADRTGTQLVLVYDVPATLGPTFLPGQLVAWDGSAFTSFWLDPAWPLSSVANGVSFLPDPGTVPDLRVNPSALTPGDLSISWAPSTSAGVEDYGIYEGTIGSWYSHTAIDCSDALGDRQEDVTPGTGNRYYLVVPLNANDEGGYGTDSNAAIRPRGSGLCRPTQALDCP